MGALQGETSMKWRNLTLKKAQRWWPVAQPPPINHESVTEPVSSQLRLTCLALSGHVETVGLYDIDNIAEVLDRIAHAFQIDRHTCEIKLVCAGEVLNERSTEEEFSKLCAAAALRVEVTVLVQQRSEAVLVVASMGMAFCGKTVEQITRHSNSAGHYHYVLLFSDGSSKSHGGSQLLD